MTDLLKRWRDFHRANPIFTSLICALVASLLSASGLLASPLHGLPLLLGPILLDDVNTVTTKTIMPGVVDNFFKAGPLVAYLKTRFTRRWIGPQIQENYMYAP